MSIDSKLNLQRLEKYIKLLTDNYKLKLEELPLHPEVNKSYELVTNINKMDLNNEVVGIISKQYRPSQIMPDTVGSFLFGCFQQTYGDIPAECSPLCAYSINNGENLTMERCDSQIHIQYLDDMKEQRFIKLGNSKNPQGYIFVKLDFLGFTSQEKEYFSSNGLSRIQVLVTKDSKHHTVLRMRNLDEIPIIEKSGANYYINSSSMMNTENGFKDSSEALVEAEDHSTMVYVALAIIIIGMIAMMNRN